MYLGAFFAFMCSSKQMLLLKKCSLESESSSVILSLQRNTYFKPAFWLYTI